MSTTMTSSATTVADGLRLFADVIARKPGPFPRRISIIMHMNRYTPADEPDVAPTIAQIQAIAEALGTSVDVVTHGERVYHRVDRAFGPVRVHAVAAFSRERST